MDLSIPESISIKREPGSQEEGGGETPYTDIDINLPDLKRECLQYSRSIKSADIMDFTAIKPETLAVTSYEEEGSRLYTEEDLSHPGIKTEYLEYSGAIGQSADIKDFTAIKREPLAVTSDEEEGSRMYTEEDAFHPGIKTQYLEYSGAIGQGADIMDFTAIKREPLAVTSYEEEGSRLNTEEDAFHPGIKTEYLEYSGAIGQSADYQPIKQETEEDEHKNIETLGTSEYMKEFKKTASKDEYRHPIRNKDKVFACNQCNSVFAWKNQLEIHSLVHTGEKPFSCSKCSSVFNQKSNWKTHMLIHSGDKPFACPHCSAAFSRKSTLKTHIFQHTGEKPFVCTQCSAAFAHEISLKTHDLSHYGLKPFSCDQCNATFTRKTGLDRHILSHSGEKPFPCTQCSSAFTQKSSLKTHMLSHTGVKPFACYLCSFTCSVSISLKRHILIHTGEKPFSCALCDYTCSQKSRLKNHLRRHTEKHNKTTT